MPKFSTFWLLNVFKKNIFLYILCFCLRGLLDDNTFRSRMWHEFIWIILYFEQFNEENKSQKIIIILFQVAELVTSEFFEQGDRERSELKLTPSVSTSHHICCLFLCVVCFTSVPFKQAWCWGNISFAAPKHTDCAGNMRIVFFSDVFIHSPVNMWFLFLY